MYLVHITQLEPRRLDLETVWVLDGESRSIYKAQVDRSTDSQDPTEMILRIRFVLPSTACTSAHYAQSYVQPCAQSSIM